MKRSDFFNPDSTYVPKYSKRVFGEAFKKIGKYIPWVIYSQFLQASPYIKEYIARRQNRICVFCGKPLFENMNYNIVHHRDYLNYCSFHNSIDDLIREPKPTYLKPNRTVPIPNCEYCKRHNENDFKDCTERLMILHDECHTKLHFNEQQLNEWKPIKYVKYDYEIISHNPIKAGEKRNKKMEQCRICKKCGESMIKRKGPFGEFWGCYNFPKCKYTEVM